MKVMVSKRQASEMLGVSVTTVSRIIARGDIPAYKVGGQIRIREEAISQYLATAIVEKESANGSAESSNT